MIISTLFTLRQLGKEASLFFELVESALFHDLPFFKHENLVTLFDCAHPMSDDDGGSALHGAFESLLDFLLGVFVQS